MNVPAYRVMKVGGTDAYGAARTFKGPEDVPVRVRLKAKNPELNIE